MQKMLPSPQSSMSTKTVWFITIAMIATSVMNKQLRFEGEISTIYLQCNPLEYRKGDFKTVRGLSNQTSPAATYSNRPSRSSKAVQSFLSFPNTLPQPWEPVRNRATRAEA